MRARWTCNTTSGSIQSHFWVRSFFNINKRFFWFLVYCFSDSPEKCERLVLPLSLSASSGRLRESFGISGLGHVVSIPASAAIICMPKRIQFSVEYFVLRFLVLTFLFVFLFLSLFFYNFDHLDDSLFQFPVTSCFLCLYSEVKELNLMLTFQVKTVNNFLNIINRKTK